MSLKNYQRESLLAVKRFWSLVASQADHAVSFAEVAADQGLPTNYSVHALLSGVPAVCVQYPTGGGKTYFAAAAAGIAMETIFQRDHITILWLVPSEGIESQTLRTLRNVRHLNHIALRDGAGLSAGIGHMRIVGVEQALAMDAAEFVIQSVVIVGTVQSFKRAATARKTLKTHEYNPNLKCPLIEHIAKRNPLVIVDEAHNSRTELQAETLAMFAPKAILEITATPVTNATADNHSNVIFQAKPQDLHAEAMIRLPIRAAALPDPETAVQWALARRTALETAASASSDHGHDIRPIVLIQAANSGPDGTSWDHERVRSFLVGPCHVPEAWIATHTGDDRDLDGHDLLSSDSHYRIVITKSALREGWDCPWAYILCALRPIHSETDGRQIVGRVLRQYEVRQCLDQQLNEAWIVAPNADIESVLGDLRSVLVNDLGFGMDDAAAAVSVARGTTNDQTVINLPLPNNEPAVFADVNIDPAVAATIAADPGLRGRVTLNPAERTISVTHTLSEAEARKVASAVSDVGDRAAVLGGLRSLAARFAQNADMTVAATAALPIARPVPTVIGVELAGTQGTIGDCFSLVDYEPGAGVAEFPFTAAAPSVRLGSVDVTATGETLTSTGEIQVLDSGILIADVRARLTSFLRTSIQTHVRMDLYPFIETVLTNLIRNGQSTSALWFDRYRLSLVLSERLNADIWSKQRDRVDETLFAIERPVVSSDRYIAAPAHYRPASRERTHVWRKHFDGLGPADGMNANELLVAKAIDAHADVQSWMRNISKHEHAFHIPRRPSRGNKWFYPDFVAWLNSGKIVVIEHKGGAEQQDDVDDKQHAGDWWAEKTDNRFIMTHDDQRGNVDLAELRRVLSAR